MTGLEVLVAILESVTAEVGASATKAGAAVGEVAGKLGASSAAEAFISEHATIESSSEGLTLYPERNGLPGAVEVNPDAPRVSIEGLAKSDWMVEFRDSEVEPIKPTSRADQTSPAQNLPKDVGGNKGASPLERANQSHTMPDEHFMPTAETLPEGIEWNEKYIKTPTERGNYSLKFSDIHIKGEARHIEIPQKAVLELGIPSSYANSWPMKQVLDRRADPEGYKAALIWSDVGFYFLTLNFVIPFATAGGAAAGAVVATGVGGSLGAVLGGTIEIMIPAGVDIGTYELTRRTAATELPPVTAADAGWAVAQQVGMVFGAKLLGLGIKRLRLIIPGKWSSTGSRGKVERAVQAPEFQPDVMPQNVSAKKRADIMRSRVSRSLGVQGQSHAEQLTGLPFEERVFTSHTRTTKSGTRKTDFYHDDKQLEIGIIGQVKEKLRAGTRLGTQDVYQILDTIYEARKLTRNTGKPWTAVLVVPDGTPIPRKLKPFWGRELVVFAF